MRRTFSAACAMMTVVALASCGDSTGPELAPDEGLVTSSYSGAVGGRFSARGGARPASPPAVEYAEARRQPGYLDVWAGNPLANGRQDGMRLTAYFEPAPGTYPLCSVVLPDSGQCVEVLVFINLDPGSSGVKPGEYVFAVASSGSVTFEELSGGRARGTFSGNIMGSSTFGAIEVTSGRFDVPIRDI
jgi:hypothetical protein